MGGIPTLGYPTRCDAVQALRQKGQTRKEIAVALQTTYKNVRSLEQYAESRGRPRRPDQRRRITISERARALLQPYADQRDISVQVLARRLLETAASDGLVGGILDDRDLSA